MGIRAAISGFFPAMPPSTRQYRGRSLPFFSKSASASASAISAHGPDSCSPVFVPTLDKLGRMQVQVQEWHANSSAFSSDSSPPHCLSSSCSSSPTSVLSYESAKSSFAVALELDQQPQQQVEQQRDQEETPGKPSASSSASSSPPSPPAAFSPPSPPTSVSSRESVESSTIAAPELDQQQQQAQQQQQPEEYPDKSSSPQSASFSPPSPPLSVSSSSSSPLSLISSRSSSSSSLSSYEPESPSSALAPKLDRAEKAEQEQHPLAVLGSRYPTQFVPSQHPLAAEVVETVHTFFLQHWPFPSEKARRKYVGSDLAGAMCRTWPSATNDRIFLACRLFTVLFLVDDLLEDMSLDEGRAYNDRLLDLIRGNCSPDPDLPAEWITHKVWKEMRACDPVLAHEALCRLETFMGAQTDSIRLEPEITLDQYLKWRIEDVGAPLITSIGCFSSGLVIPAEDRALLADLDANWSRHVIFLNDAWSFDKEFVKAHEGEGEGSVLCNSVTIVAKQTGVSIDIAKRLLITIVRELEGRHNELARELFQKKDTAELRRYVQLLEWQMSGNEVWTQSTTRYRVPAETISKILTAMGRRAM